jgi:hypothetical protein
MKTLLRATTISLVASLGLMSAAWAETLTLPSEEVVLTVTGEIAHTNSGESAQFDLDMLMDMDATIIETSTIWTEGEQTFQGVALHVLLDALGVEDGTLLATAINDYTVEIPVSDAVAGGPIIAYMQNDEAMSVRDKGPLWVVYPYDSSAIYRSEVVYSRSIWQLDRIAIIQ